VKTKSLLKSERFISTRLCGDPSLEKSKGYWVQDCSAAIENILLQATEEGLGAVWCGVYPREERMEAVRELLQIPKNILPLALIPFGYPAKKQEQSKRFNPDRIHENKW
jgi:nitroreductase